MFILIAKINRLIVSLSLSVNRDKDYRLKIENKSINRFVLIVNFRNRFEKPLMEKSL